MDHFLFCCYEIGRFSTADQHCGCLSSVLLLFFYCLCTDQQLSCFAAAVVVLPLRLLFLEKLLLCFAPTTTVVWCFSLLYDPMLFCCCCLGLMWLAACSAGPSKFSKQLIFDFSHSHSVLYHLDVLWPSFAFGLILSPLFYCIIYYLSLGVSLGMFIPLPGGMSLALRRSCRSMNFWCCMVLQMHGD